MKFAEHLTAHITPEWRKQYIHYEDMKQILYQAMEQAPSAEVVEPEVIARYYAKFDEQFFTYCDKELAMINTFYSEKFAEATRKYAALKSELAVSKNNNGQGGEKANKLGRTLKRSNKQPVMKISDLKLAFSEFYLSLILLQNYQNLNFTGFRKILKKHDKLIQTTAGAKWRTEHVEQAHFYTNKDIDKLLSETEATVTHELEGGDRQKAMKRLRVPPLGERKSDLTTLKVGFFTGAFVCLFVTMVVSAIFHNSQENNWRIIVRLYRGPMLIALFLFFMGLNVQGWRKSGVNHVLIFELDPRHHLTEQHLLELASVLGVLWTLSVLAFLYSKFLGIPPYVNPLALAVTMVLFLLNPTRTFVHEARFWFLRKLGRALCAPFFFVGFADFWLADQLNSLVPVLLDFQYMICFYATNEGNWYTATDYNKCVDKTWFIRPVVACLPAYLRFAQCLRRYRDTKEKFPHLANAGKYTTTFFVVIFSTLYHTYEADGVDKNSNYPFFYTWIVFSFISSIYAYIWDMKMDWGLFDSNAGDNRLLREEIVYSHVAYYYFGIIEDFVLRFGWAFSLSLTEMGYIHGDLMLSILAPLEVFRRFVWNFFRLENEHLNNCGKFRAVRDISIAPMDASDQAAILKMMDEPDGVVNRRVRKKTVSSQPVAAGSSITQKDPVVRFQNVKISSAAESIGEESGTERD
ncbi:Xenotropic and polytropic retrovirus receptor 1-like protein [Daphnia sinensis]|uniref:Xenotropic and polytropic retrovirus receptor 1-like protein n=1 Tax=Daphnia sinensis TaxID=1820382 RepID=A0AAD5PUX0_9CRUS|nr:Xenotropic and polytropic retrovirus receptor 1-like protein [Daphnia sinensis]